MILLISIICRCQGCWCWSRRCRADRVCGHARPWDELPKRSTQPMGKMDALAIRFTYLAEHADEFNFYLISLCKQQSLERFFHITCNDYPYYSNTVRTANAGVSQPLHLKSFTSEGFNVFCKTLCRLELHKSGNDLVPAMLMVMFSLGLRCL